MLITKHKSVIKLQNIRQAATAKRTTLKRGAREVADANVFAASGNVEACQLQHNKMSYEFEMLHVAYEY